MPRYLLEIDPNQVGGHEPGKVIRRMFEARDDTEARRKVDRAVMLTRIVKVEGADDR